MGHVIAGPNGYLAIGATVETDATASRLTVSSSADGRTWTGPVEVAGVGADGVLGISGQTYVLATAEGIWELDGAGIVLTTCKPIFETPGAVSWQATPYTVVGAASEPAALRIAGPIAVACGRSRRLRKLAVLVTRT